MKLLLTSAGVRNASIHAALVRLLDYPDFPENTLAHAQRWAARIGGAAHAIDDQAAIQVADGRVEVVSEGNSRYLDG